MDTYDHVCVVLKFRGSFKLRDGRDFFEGSVAEPRRTFVTDLVTDLNKTRWLVTHPSLRTLVTHLR